MALKLYNDLTKKLEEFSSINPQKVKMYVCGITPYDETHLGHARAYITFDVIRRYLEYIGYEVIYIQNFTDIDDKIIKKANSLDFMADNMKEERSLAISCKLVSEKYINSYFEVMDRLNVKRAAFYPKATEHIQEIINWIERLINNGYAYVLGHDVYFKILSFPDYGKLSGRNIEDMKAGSRIEIDQRKQNPFDFALWKEAKDGEPFWDSPWGKGRPGWHIECSVMATKYLGEQFDIHGGGQDLGFPHHENEIAQTETLTKKHPWVRFWMHNGFVNINQEKMSKSLGNFFSIKDILKQYHPMVVRMFLLMTQYKKPINFSNIQLNESKTAYERIIKTIKDLDFLISKVREPEAPVEVFETEDELVVFKNKFDDAMNEDFNTALAIGVIFDFISFINKHVKSQKIDVESLKRYKAFLFELCGVLGVLIDVNEGGFLDKDEIEKLIEARNSARENKNFKQADEIRNRLFARGIILQDTAFGTKWSKN